MDHIPRVASAMTPFPHFVQVDDSVLHARELMVEHGVHHLPVKRGTMLVGILTDRDLKRALDPELGLPPKEKMFVQDVYVAEPCVVDSGTPLDEVLETMATRQVGSVLVTSHDRLAGIFTATDACRAYCAHLRALFPAAGENDVA
jgi:acetoin utilization protein AcuB